MGLSLGVGLPVSTTQGRNDKEGASRRREHIQKGREGGREERQSHCSHLDLVATVVMIVGLLLLCYIFNLILSVNKDWCHYLPP